MGPGIAMDDGATAVRNRSGPGSSPGPPGPPGRRRVQAHHRRRRSALALALVALVALIGGIATGAGGGTATHHFVVHGSGYFSRLQTLAGTGPGSFVGAERAAENAAI